MGPLPVGFGAVPCTSFLCCVTDQPLHCCFSTLFVGSVLALFLPPLCWEACLAASCGSLWLCFWAVATCLVFCWGCGSWGLLWWFADMLASFLSRAVSPASLFWVHLLCALCCLRSPPCFFSGFGLGGRLPSQVTVRLAYRLFASHGQGMWFGYLCHACFSRFFTFSPSALVGPLGLAICGMVSVILVLLDY